MRKPDAWCLLKENEDIMVLVRSKERAEAWHADYPDLPLYPLFRRKPDDRETLMAAAAWILNCPAINDHGEGCECDECKPARTYAAKLREMAGEKE